MNRIAQGMVLVLLGATALGATVFSELYLNYVQGAFRPFLIASGAVLIALGAIVVAADVRGASHGADRPGGHGSDGHGHDRAPRIAWLLVLPALAVFVVAPPALGAYTANAAAPGEGPDPDRVDLSRYDEDPFTEAGDGPVELELQEFVSLAWTDEDRRLSGRTVELTGFAVDHPDGDGWYLARLQMACCAADAVVNRVLITDEPAPDEDSWWTVRAVWDEPEGDLQDVRDHRVEVDDIAPVDDPPDPYE
ncbi:TIGR03943 family putative permease subunit [Nocardiopsis coralliicola]